jgi:hypothetical protein
MGGGPPSRIPPYIGVVDKKRGDNPVKEILGKIFWKVGVPLLCLYLMGKSYNLHNQKFGKLTVISKLGKDKKGHNLWECNCDCGNTVIKNTSCLTSTKTKTPSCGCSNPGPLGGIDHKGKKYNKLTVLEKLNKKGKNGSYYWLCKCDCGNLTEVSSGGIRRTVSCGCYKSERMTGSNSPLWRGGITIDGWGYRKISVGGGKRIHEHRVIYEQHYGVKLKPYQNIHHINGDKKDNRIENLELWDTSQPAGQRVEDKINYYFKLVEDYKDHPMYKDLINPHP